MDSFKTKKLFTPKDFTSPKIKDYKEISSWSLENGQGIDWQSLPSNSIILYIGQKPREFRVKSKNRTSGTDFKCSIASGTCVIVHEIKDTKWAIAKNCRAPFGKIILYTRQNS